MSDTVQYSKKKKPFFILLMATIPVLLLVAGFLGVEKYYSSQWYFPGSFVRYFQPVDSLEINDEMITDSLGIQTANPVHYRNNTDFINSGYRINDHGFRSDEFLPYSEQDSTAKTILFLGDSHTWGASANPITECFVDLINRTEYVTFNTGIPGGDPAQYWVVAKKYIPYLRPKFCFLVFDGSNDVMWFRRDPKPFIPLDYWTNAGIIDAWKSQWIENSEGDYFKSAQEAYDYFIEAYTLFGKDASAIARLCSKSVILTAAYKKLTGWQDPQHKVSRPDKPCSDYYLDKIDSLCKAYNIPLQIFLIPDMDEFTNDIAAYESLYPGLFVNHKVLIPQDVTPEDYVPDEYHFDNKGHRKMADFMLEYLKKPDSLPE